jgi:hypothetical protein
MVSNMHKKKKHHKIIIIAKVHIEKHHAATKI